MSKPLGPQQLPPNEQHQFKNVGTYYERKQYDRALRAADSILAKFPNHGETTAMKALVQNSLEKRPESFELARKALTLNATSHMCWHIMGLLYKNERAYYESIKCFKMGMYFDADNQNILRDLASSQIQVRDYDGFYITRKRLVRLKPDLKLNWITFSIAAHLNSNPESALASLKILQEEILDKRGKDDDYGPVEQNELELYKVQLHHAIGDYEAALSVLEAKKSVIVDKLLWREVKGETLLKLNRNAEAEAIYRELIEVNPENVAYHVGLHKTLSAYPGANASYSTLSEARLQQLIAVYKELQEKFPKSVVVQRYPLLHLLSGEAFRSAFAAYAMPQLTKGIPSMFNSLKPLYKEEAKVQAIEEWMLQAKENLKTIGDATREPPSSLLWVLAYLAQHFSVQRKFTEALANIDEAIEHTPTVLDLYLFKARIYKHAGAPEKAAELVEKARTMDLADRYLNTKSTHYFLRSNNIEKARTNISIFTQIEAEQYNNIYDMQVMWYEQAEGDAWMRKKEYGKALKKYTDTEKHFLDVIDDQHDFHSYSLRKFTVGAYLDLLTTSEKLLGHKFYVRAAQSAIRAYLAIIDAPTPKTAEKVSKAKPEPEKPKKKLFGGRQEFDPEGERLKNTTQPLVRAHRFVSNLLQFAPNDLQTQLLAAEVFLRLDKLMLSLKAVKKAIALDTSQNPGVHLAIVKLFHKISQAQGLNAVVTEVFKAETAEILKGKSPAEYNLEYLSAHKQCFKARFHVAQALLVLDSQANKQKALELISDVSSTDYPLQALLAAYNWIELRFTSADADAFKQAAHKTYPLISAFAPEEAPATTAAPVDEGENPAEQNS